MDHVDPPRETSPVTGTHHDHHPRKCICVNIGIYPPTYMMNYNVQYIGFKRRHVYAQISMYDTAIFHNKLSYSRAHSAIPCFIENSVQLF